MNDIFLSGPDAARSAPRIASILAHLGGRDFLVSIGARNFLFGDTQVSFTISHHTEAWVVTIGLETSGSFSIACFGGNASDAQRLATAIVAAGANVAAALGELVEIEALRMGPAPPAGRQQAAALN
jgi:hypothetical protein